jgi:hypothetical protein
MDVTQLALRAVVVEATAAMAPALLELVVVAFFF